MKYKSIVSQVFGNYSVNIFVLLFWMFQFSLPGYSQHINFKHININEGLSQNAVFDILKDNKGFMWFGTKDGLNKYDGYNFIIYQHNPFDTTTLSANYITCLFEDKRGYIWVGTNDGGVNVYDRKSETFHRIDLGENSLLQRNIFEIKAIIEDADSNIWIATSGDGLLKLKVNENNDGNLSFTEKWFVNEPDNANCICSNQVFLRILIEGTLWLGTSEGLDRLDVKTETFTHFVINTKNLLHLKFLLLNQFMPFTKQKMGHSG